MKLLFPINAAFYPAQGGPSNVVYWIAKALRKKNIVPTIIATNSEVEGKVAPDQWIETDYGRVIYHTSRFLLFPWRMMISTVTTIRHSHIVHLTSLFYPSSILFAITALWYCKPVLWAPHGELDRLALIYSTWKKKPILWFIQRFLAKNITFHSTCPAETQRVKTVLGQHIKVLEIPNFIELPIIVVATPAVPLYLLYIGRLHPKKAIGNLLTAIAISPKFKAEGLNLIIAGDYNNSYAEQLRQQVKCLGLQQKVQFIGPVDGEEKQKLYADAHFLVLPSHTENFGNVVVEALAQGTPVIASMGTPWAVLEEKQAGFWVDNKPMALAAALEKALHLSSEDYQQYRNRAMTLAHQSFDIHENVEQWITAYQTVIANYKHFN